RLLHGGIDEAARVHDDKVGTLVRGGDVVALGTKLREDRFRIDERLRATETDETDLGHCDLTSLPLVFSRRAASPWRATASAAATALRSKPAPNTGSPRRA